MKFISFSLLLILVSCNLLAPKRKPAAINIISGNHRVELNISFKDLQLAFSEAVKLSPVISSIDQFYMDPVTRIFNIKLTANYPIDKLLDYTSLPSKTKLSDEHIIEMAFKFSKTKNLYTSRYVGLQLTKFKIDHDDYLNQFELVLSVIQTVLANSSLTDYLLIEGREKLPKGNTIALVTEAFDKNIIRVFPTTRKINLKLDLRMISKVSPFIDMYQDLNLWRLSPSILKIRDEATYYKDPLLPEDVAFTVAIGEGKPDESYTVEQAKNISDDNRTIEEVRTELYETYSNLADIRANAEIFKIQVMRGEETPLKRLLEKKISLEGQQGKEIIEELRIKYQSYLDEALENIERKASKILSKDNDHFLAAPEYEYGEFLNEMKASIRSHIFELDRKFIIDYDILQKGKHFSQDKPMLVKRVSQNFLNKAINAAIDIEIEGSQIIDELSVWLMPHKNGIALKGKSNVPFKVFKAKENLGLDLESMDLKRYIVPGNTGIPFEMFLSLKMGDEGILGLDLESLTFKMGGIDQTFTRKSKNQKFLFDFAKMYLAKTLSSLEIDLNDTTDPKEAKKREAKQVLKYLAELKIAYQKEKLVENVMISDFLINPFNSAGLEHINKKKKILLGKLIQFNESNQLFEIKVDPKIIIDKVNNVSHNLQLWDISPVMSSELNNTFLELSVGHGQRSKDFIHNQYRRNGVAENANHNGIYYNLGEERASVDLLMSLNFEYIEKYVNNFLGHMVAINNSNIEVQAEKNPGETFYEVSDIALDITENKTFKIAVKVSSAKYGLQMAFWRGRKTTVDTHTIHAELDLKSTKYQPKNSSILDLVYYPSAIQVNPLNARIAPGSSNSFMSKALSGILNASIRFGLKNNGTVKKLLLKMMDKITKSMYISENGQINGHEIEKFVRIHTTSNEILLFLNPKIAGPAFNMHLSGDENPVNTAIKFDPKEKIMHFAMTAGAGMAKNHKKELINIYKELNLFLKDFEKIQSKKELKSLLKGQDFAQKLVHEKSLIKRSFYNRLIAVLVHYDQILHVTKLANKIEFSEEIRLPENDNVITSEAERTRISASGAELIYFAAIGKHMHNKLKMVSDKMTKFQLNSKTYGFTYIKDARDILDQNFSKPLLKRYKDNNHEINKIIITNPPSYWTYQVYPNAYFAEEAYNIIK
ncbi:MAG: hypothetical protein ACJAS4_002763 [Bacteriovoracaceae bacterium]|jgi:hypothetical protein